MRIRDFVLGLTAGIGLVLFSTTNVKAGDSQSVEMTPATKEAS